MKKLAKYYQISLMTFLMSLQNLDQYFLEFQDLTLKCIEIHPENPQ